MSIKTNTLDSFRRLWPIISEYKKGIIIAIIALLLSALANTALLYLLKPLLDDGIGSSDSYYLRIIALLLVILFAIRSGTNLISTYALSWVSGKVIMTLRQLLFNHIMHMPVSFFDQTSTGELLSKITYDSEQVANASSDSLIIIARELVTIISLIILMLYASWKLTLIIFIIAPIIGGLISLISHKFRQISQNMQTAMGEISEKTEQMLKGHKVVISYNGQELETKNFAKVSNDMRQQSLKLVKYAGISEVIVQFIASLALAAVLWIASIPNMFDETLTVGTFSMIFASMFALLQPLKSVTKINATFQRGIAASKSLFDLLDQPIEVDTGHYSKRRVIGNIIFDNVTFTYPTKQQPALEQVSFIIPAGKTVALVGKSGSGKTTISNLLMRFYDVEQGSITLDGVALDNYKLSNLRSQFALVSQNIHLFNDTIANNIAYAATEQYSRAEIQQAAEMAYVTNFTDQLELGLDTIIGEDGITLSGGQRQRIAIARAILRNSPILILDEATSALDNESERMIQNALRCLQRNRTCIMIAHRLSTIENADLILVMQHGKIAEQGKHHALLYQQGVYSQLYSSQFIE